MTNLSSSKEKYCKDLTIVANRGDFKTYWTIEIDKKFKTKKEAGEFYIKLERLITT